MSTSIIDDHYQFIIFIMRMSKKHKAFIHIEWALSIGMVTKANKKELFVMLMDHVPRFEAH